MRSFQTLIVVLALGVLSACGGGGSVSETATASPPADTGLQEPLGAGVSLVSLPKGEALVGQPFSGRVVVVPNDARNSVTGLSIANTTGSGAAPTVDANGAVTWVPNEVDYQSTRLLRLTVRVATGEPQTVDVPVAVRKQRVVLETVLPASAGTLADPGGRYLIRVDAATAGAPMSGLLKIVETYDATGSFRYTVSVPATSNARVTVLDAPRSYRSPPAAAATAGPANRQYALAAASEQQSRPLAETAADGLIADVGRELGGEFLSGDLGLVANVGQVNVYTTRSTLFHYTRNSEAQIHTETPQVSKVFQIDANCTTSQSCRDRRSTEAAPTRRSPVILIHGFNLGQSVGGGDGTWGSLARTLTDRGHPVFELRWNTYMRFEEAAGVLATLSRRVAELTGQKVMVLAHSFGGVVVHTAAMGRGIRFDGSSWNAVDVNGVFARLLTLGSPLSGIRKVPAQTPLNLTGGRDDDDGTITLCEAITCYQAGSSDQWDSAEVTELVDKVKAIDPQRTGLPDTTEGATIRALHTAWQSSRGHAVPFSTVVSLKKRPIDDYAPNLTNTTAHDLGDGLISMMGQSVVPEDFALSPFAARTSHDILGRMGSDFFTRLDAAHAINMVRVTRDNDREYYFALRAAHSSGQNLGVSYRIAFYPAGGTVNVASEPVADHPLNHFIRTGTSYFAASPIVFSGPTESPTAVVSGRTVLNGTFSSGQAVSFQLELATTGAPVSDELVQISRSLNGSFSFDAGRVLAERFPGQLINIADYKVVVRAGDGLQLARLTLRQSLATQVSLGDLDLTPPTTALVSASGNVIDGQTQGQIVPSADVFLMKGLYQAETVVRQIANTSTSRRLVTDATGRFSVVGLQPGDYTVVVSKAGYLTQSQGAVRLSSTTANSLSFSLLKALQGNAASITLRWGAATTGPLVSRDLDSHLRKYNATGQLTYHIYYGSRTGSSTDSLDRDDTDYVGPETITLTLDSTSSYRYYVHNYMSSNGSTIGGSSPTVIVRIGSTLQEFSLPVAEQSTAIYWRVFDVVNGRVVPCATACLGNVEPQ